MSIRLDFSLLTEPSKEGLVPRIIQSLGKRSLSTSHPYRPGRQHVQHHALFPASQTWYLMPWWYPLLSRGSSACPWTSVPRTTSALHANYWELLLPVPVSLLGDPSSTIWPHMVSVLHCLCPYFLDDVPLRNTCSEFLMLSSVSWMRPSYVVIDIACPGDKQ